MHPQLKTLIAATLMAAFCNAAHAAGNIVITDPVSRATPAGAPTGIG